MKVKSIAIAAALAVGSIGIAYASPINLLTNGDFSQTNNGTSVPTQFGNGSGNGFTAQQFITGWTGNDGYEIWYPDATAAQNQNAIGEWTSTGKEELYGNITSDMIPAPPGATAFVGLDGDQAAGVQSSIGQTLTGLTIGASYTVSFVWGAAQLQSRTGDTTSYLKVSFGSDSWNTTAIDNPSGSFTGWMTSSHTFVADSDTAFLNFLSVGTPSGLPPVAVLANASVTHVPEPSELATFGGGLLGLGLLMLFGRRYEKRRRLAEAGALG